MDGILTVKNLRTYYYSGNRVVPAVDGVSFELAKGEVLGVVGESGCGKSTLARSIVGLYNKNNTRIEGGEVWFEGQNLLALGSGGMSEIRGNVISMIFQDPFTSLNPVYTVGSQVFEILRRHKRLSKKEAMPRIIELLQLVGISSPEQRVNSYPYQLSGGMQQRIMIAIALACNPSILIADEPTTALDVTVQAQILSLMSAIGEKMDMGIMFITHNLGVIAQMSDRMLVMYGGVAVEQGPVHDIFMNPAHPYTKGLLAAIPNINIDKEELETIRGTVPKFTLPINECRFASRCSDCFDKCLNKEPPMFELDDEKRLVRCWLYEEKGGLRLE